MVCRVERQTTCKGYIFFGFLLSSGNFNILQIMMDFYNFDHLLISLVRLSYLQPSAFVLILNGNKIKRLQLF